MQQFSKLRQPFRWLIALFFVSALVFACNNEAPKKDTPAVDPSATTRPETGGTKAAGDMPPVDSSATTRPETGGTK